MTPIIVRLPLEKLTPREIEVLTLTAYGKTRPEISSILSISTETVKAYIERVCRKLDAANKTHAATVAVVLGLITPYRMIVAAEGVVRGSASEAVVPQTGNFFFLDCPLLGDGRPELASEENADEAQIASTSQSKPSRLHINHNMRKK